jgi:hypothetical protein
MAAHLKPDPDQPAIDKPGRGRPDKKITLTVSTLSGDHTDEFPPKQKLKVVVEKAIKEIPLEGTGPWILEHQGAELSQDQTIEDAGLEDGDVLTLNPQEGGGGSRR